MGDGFGWRRSLLLLVGVGLLSVLPLPFPAAAGEKASPSAGAKAILLVSFGSSVESAQKVYANIEAAVRARFAGVEVRWAFTAKQIRKKLAAQGKVALSPAQALANLGEEGFRRVAAQSLHIIPGEEFEGLVETARRFSGMPKGLERVEVGAALLSSAADRERAVMAMLAHLPRQRQPQESVIFMGHGSPGPANAVYAAMAGLFHKADPNAHLAVVAGEPEFSALARQLTDKGAKSAWLVPLMSVAGEHALKDMAGPQEDSWSSQLAKAGITPKPVLVGMAERAEIVAIWLDHLQMAYQRLDRE